MIISFKRHVCLSLVSLGFLGSFLIGRVTAPQKALVSDTSVDNQDLRVNRPRAVTSSSERITFDSEHTSVAREAILGNGKVFDFASYTGVRSPAEERELLNKLLESMAHDPEATFQFAESQINILGEDGIEMLLIEWARKDPYAAWLKAIEKFPNHKAKVLAATARDNLELALEIAQEHYETPLDSYDAIAGIIRESYNDGNFAQAFELVKGLTFDSNESSLFYDVIISDWVRYTPREAARWIDSLEKGEMRNSAQISLIENWSYLDPINSLAYFQTEVEEGDFRSNGIIESLNQWTGKDFLAASDWIVENGLTSEYDDSAYQVAISAPMAQYPEIAIDWIQSLSDTELQNDGLKNIYRRWLRSDPEAARNHMQSSDSLSEETRALLKNEYEQPPVEDYEIPKTL